jgi:hypothetical protein
MLDGTDPFESLPTVFVRRFDTEERQLLVCQLAPRITILFVGTGGKLSRNMTAEYETGALQSVPICHVEETVLIRVAYHRGSPRGWAAKEPKHYSHLS